MEGIYRIHGPDQELFESFVAAPGPAGWRYFGRIFPAAGQEEVSTVDLVVDSEWRLVRYRERHAAGQEVVVIPANEGLEVVVRQGGEERSVEVPEVEVVWSLSPSSVLVAGRRAGALDTTNLQGIRIDLPNDPAPVLLSLAPSDQSVTTAAGSPHRIEIRVDGRTIKAVLREDRPVSAEGWFELIT